MGIYLQLHRQPVQRLAQAGIVREDDDFWPESASQQRPGGPPDQRLVLPPFQQLLPAEPGREAGGQQDARDQVSTVSKAP